MSGSKFGLKNDKNSFHLCAKLSTKFWQCHSYLQNVWKVVARRAEMWLCQNGFELVYQDLTLWPVKKFRFGNAVLSLLAPLASERRKERGGVSKCVIQINLRNHSPSHSGDLSCLWQLSGDLNSILFTNPTSPQWDEDNDDNLTTGWTAQAVGD